METKSRIMKGTITEHLLVQYMDSTVDQERQIPTIVRRLLPIPEEQKEYAKKHIGEEVEFVKWDGGRLEGNGPAPSPIAWIQIKAQKYTVVVPFKGKHVTFHEISQGQKDVLDHYFELSNSGPRRSAQTNLDI